MPDLVVDCTTGQATQVPLTPQEIAARAAAAQALADAEAARLAIANAQDTSASQLLSQASAKVAALNARKAAISGPGGAVATFIAADTAEANALAALPTTATTATAAAVATYLKGQNRTYQVAQRAALNALLTEVSSGIDDDIDIITRLANLVAKLTGSTTVIS